MSENPSSQYNNALAFGEELIERRRQAPPRTLSSYASTCKTPPMSSPALIDVALDSPFARRVLPVTPEGSPPETPDGLASLSPGPEQYATPAGKFLTEKRALAFGSPPPLMEKPPIRAAEPKQPQQQQPQQQTSLRLSTDPSEVADASNDVSDPLTGLMAAIGELEGQVCAAEPSTA